MSIFHVGGLLLFLCYLVGGLLSQFCFKKLKAPIIHYVIIILILLRALYIQLQTYNELKSINLKTTM